MFDCANKLNTVSDLEMFADGSTRRNLLRVRTITKNTYKKELPGYICVTYVKEGAEDSNVTRYIFYESSMKQQYDTTVTEYEIRLFFTPNVSCNNPHYFYECV